MAQNTICIKCETHCNEETSLVLNFENDLSIYVCEACLNGRISNELINECIEKLEHLEREKINKRHRSN